MGMQGGLGGLGTASAARLAVYAAIAVVVGAVLGGLVDLRFGSDVGGADAEPASPEQVEAPPTEEDDTPLAETVEVVETGFTARSRLFCNGADEDPSDGCEGCSIAAGCGIHPAGEVHLVSYGVVVRNTGDHLLKNIPVTIGFVDAAGQPVGLRDGGGSDVHISRLLPGEELGLGDTTDVDRGGATEMRVEIGAQAERVSPDYARATADLAGLAEATSGQVFLHGFGALDRDGQPVEWTVDFTVDTELPEDVACPALCVMGAIPHAIFRDSGGRIVGGTAGTRMDLGQGWGEIDFYLSGNMDFTDVDPDQTQVYLTDITAAVG